MGLGVKELGYTSEAFSVNCMHFLLHDGVYSAKRVLLCRSAQGWQL